MSLDITNIKALVKECLSIIQTATGKDNEIELFINAAISDMERIGINIDYLIHYNEQQLSIMLKETLV